MERGHRISDPSPRRRLYRRRVALVLSGAPGFGILLVSPLAMALIISFLAVWDLFKNLFQDIRWSCGFIRQGFLMEWRLLRDNWNNDGVRTKTTAMSRFDYWLKKNTRNR